MGTPIRSVPPGPWWQAEFTQCANKHQHPHGPLHQHVLLVLTAFGTCVPHLSSQRVRDRRPVGRRFVRPEDLQAAQGAEAGEVHASFEEAAGGPHEDHGQRGHFLHAAHALHLHLQVGRGVVSNLASHMTRQNVWISQLHQNECLNCQH